LKSFGVRVIPIESINAASPAVKYSVVNQANDCGDLSAIPEQRMVQSGNNVVAISAVLTYPSKIFWPKVFSPSEGGSAAASDSLDMMRVVDDGLFTTVLTNPATGLDGFIVMGVARFTGVRSGAVAWKACAACWKRHAAVMTDAEILILDGIVVCVVSFDGVGRNDFE